MKVLPSKKKKILFSGLGIGISAILTATVVGGYFSSISKNPYKDYYRTPATDSTQSFLFSFSSARLSGAKLLLLPGYTLINPLNAALEDKQFDDTGFLLIDEPYQGNKPYESDSVYFSTQVSSVQFRADEGSFITGIALAMYLNEYKEYFTSNDNELTWATFGGDKFDSVIAFMSGFQEGINWFNEYIASDPNNNLLPLRQEFLGTADSDNFSGSFGPAGGNAIIDKFLVTKNIDCLIPVAGAQTNDAVAKIASRSNQRTIVIGVDSAMEKNHKIQSYKLPQDPNVKSPTQVLPFSSMKNIEEIGGKIISIIDNPNLDGSDGLHGLGWHNMGTVENNGIGVSEAGKPFFIKAIQKKDSSVQTYDEAITWLKQQANFDKMGKPTNNETNIYTGQYQIKGVSQPLSYSTFINGYNFPPMSDTKPSSISNNKVNQKQWDKKRSFNLNNFVKENNQADKDKIKIILSSSDSILLDAGFSQVTYLAMYYFYYNKNINIPKDNYF